MVAPAEMSLEQFLVFYRNADEEEVLRMVVEGGPLWGLFATTVQTLRMLSELLQTGTGAIRAGDTTDEYGMLSDLRDLVAAAEHLFAKQARFMHKTITMATSEDVGVHDDGVPASAIMTQEEIDQYNRQFGSVDDNGA